jgi:hypothetical protein
MKIRMGSVSRSSLVLAIGFSGGPGDAGTLRIKFPDAILDFKRVSYATYRSLVIARDKPQKYLAMIYGRYEYTKLKA